MVSDLLCPKCGGEIHPCNFDSHVEKCDGKCRIESAPYHQIEELDDECDDFMIHIIGIESYFVTDISSITDFITGDREEFLKNVRDGVEKRYGLKLLKGMTMLVDILKEIRKHRRRREKGIY